MPAALILQHADEWLINLAVSGLFGQQRQGGSGTIFGSFIASGSAGSAGNGAGPTQGGLQFGSAGFGFNAGPQGYQQNYALDQHLGASSSGRPAAIYGYWMHTTDGGRSGYLQPGWLAAF